MSAQASLWTPPESSQVSVGSSQVPVDAPESSQGQVTVGLYEPSQITTNLPEPGHISAELPEPHHILSVVPSNALSACFIAVKETVTAVEPPEVVATAAEPSDAIYPLVSAMEATYEITACPVMATESYMTRLPLLCHRLHCGGPLLRPWAPVLSALPRRAPVPPAPPWIPALSALPWAPELSDLPWSLSAAVCFDRHVLIALVIKRLYVTRADVIWLCGQTAVMVSVVQGWMSRLLSPLWRRAQELDERREDPRFDGEAQIRQVQTGVVTHLCVDYGLIDHSVYFTSGEVLGGVVLCVGDSVQALAVRDGAHGHWIALRVERHKDAWDSAGSETLTLESDKLRPLIGTVTSCDRDGGYINQTTYFPRSALCEAIKAIPTISVISAAVLLALSQSPGPSPSTDLAHHPSPVPSPLLFLHVSPLGVLFFVFGTSLSPLLISPPGL
ncbi:uncharacterized protein LOC113046485 [Carassius auratus]|uniref:Uncharacterized protein LOC113046485 n=1 Tax=Carassius auratus TaxID=7957 RepID=A0A6P6JVH1_CARAU|nr:uncharacterized protein LOC113046485 [Carassius auratus]